MRHRDQPSAFEALMDWKAIRRKVEAEGGLQYEKPVLVRFADRGTFEVMDREIVEDKFYVLRPFKIMRELDAKGADLEQAIRENRQGGGDARQSQQRKPGGQRRPGDQRRPSDQRKPDDPGKPGDQRGPRGPGHSRRGGRSRRGQRRGGGRPQGGPPAPPASPAPPAP